MRSLPVFLVLIAVVPVLVAGANDAQKVPDPNESRRCGTATAVRRIDLTDRSRAVLWDNGPIVNCPGCGAGGADESQLQTNIGMGSLSFGNQFADGRSVADEFIVSDTFGWHVDEITFFSYQSGSTTASTITGLYVQIWDGDPSAGGSVIWGDLVTNRLLTTGWSNTYRVMDHSSGDTTRPVMEDVATVGVTLPRGTYWLQWSTDGSLSSGPWVPPITVTGQTTTGDALQYNVGWNPIVDAGTATPQGLPFIIEGSVENPPPSPPPGDFYVVDDITNDLYRVDPATGGATYVGPTIEDPSFSGMAFDTSTGIMYISDITMPNAEWGLGFVNCATGEVGIIGSHVNTRNVHALAYDPVSNQLWGADLSCASGGGLATVDRSTGESVCIGAFGTASDVYGLAFRGTTNTLYGINSTDLVTIDRTSGAATTVGTHGIPSLGYRHSLEYIPDRFALYATTASGDVYEIEPATGSSVFVGNTGFTEASASGYVPFREPAFLPFPGVLHDNGDTDFSIGFSNGLPPALNYRRSLLDDFEVPAGSSWEIRHFRWRHVWNSFTTASGTGLELLIRANDPNGGGPGIDGPGGIIATRAADFYAESPTGRTFVWRPEMLSLAEFDAVVLPPGRYWLDWAIVGPEDNFVLASQYLIHDNESWVDYADFGGLQPGSAVLGVTADFAWAVGESRIGIFADGFESGGVSAW